MLECPAQVLCLTGCMHAQVYKGTLNKTRAVAVKTFAHMASEAEVIRFNAVSFREAFHTPCISAAGAMLVLLRCMARQGVPI